MNEQASLGQSSGYVACKKYMTSPAPMPGFERVFGIGANHPCPGRIEVSIPDGAVMECRCPYGHGFYATSADVEPGPPHLGDTDGES